MWLELEIPHLLVYFSFKNNRICLISCKKLSLTLFMLFHDIPLSRDFRVRHIFGSLASYSDVIHRIRCASTNHYRLPQGQAIKITGSRDFEETPILPQVFWKIAIGLFRCKNATYADKKEGDMYIIYMIIYDINYISYI